MQKFQHHLRWLKMMSHLQQIQKSPYNMAKANPTFEGRADETTKPHDPASSPAAETPKEEVSTTDSTTIPLSVLFPEGKIDHEVTEDDLKNNPDLVEAG